MTGTYSEPLANALVNLGYHIKQVPRNKTWDIFIKTDEAFLFKFGTLQARGGKSQWGNKLTLKLQSSYFDNNSYKQDYAKWIERIHSNIDVSSKPLMKLALGEQQTSLDAFRSKIKTFPKNFNRYSTANQNMHLLPFFLANMGPEITSTALVNGYSAFHPVVNGLTDGKIKIKDIEDYIGLPIEWVRKLIY